MKIKVILNNFVYGKKLPIIKKGDWIDLCSCQYYYLKAPYANTLQRKTLNKEEIRNRTVEFDYKRISLGIAMQLPKGFEAIIAPRSSTFEKYGVIVPTSIGVIDNSYNGTTDEWQLPVLAMRNTEIHSGDRVCQFRIQLNQKATFWQKLKWFFSNKIEFEYVKTLPNKDRGGFGTTN